jgi:serine/threonine protein kinase
MVTGQKAFQGKSYSSLVGAILAMDPPPMSLKQFTPSWLERLVRRCLAKDPERRCQSIGDVLLDLEAPPPEAVAPKARLSRWQRVAAAVVLMATVPAGVILTRPAPLTDAALVEFDIAVSRRFARYHCLAERPVPCVERRVERAALDSIP